MALTKTQLEYATKRISTKLNELKLSEINALPPHPGIAPKWTDQEVTDMVLAGRVLSITSPGRAYPSLQDFLVLPPHPDFAAWEQKSVAFTDAVTAITNKYTARQNDLLDQIYLLDSKDALALIQGL